MSNIFEDYDPGDDLDIDAEFFSKRRRLFGVDTEPEVILVLEILRDCSRTFETFDENQLTEVENIEADIINAGREKPLTFKQLRELNERLIAANELPLNNFYAHDAEVTWLNDECECLLTLSDCAKIINCVPSEIRLMMANRHPDKLEYDAKNDKIMAKKPRTAKK